MIALHTSTADLKGTAYIELLPGPYRGECWGPESVFLDEEAFGFIEPIFERLCPAYGHYALTEIREPLWRTILGELDRIVALLDSSPPDAILVEQLRFFFRDAQQRFFENRDANVALLRQMVVEVAQWLRSRLDNHQVISILGI